MKILLLGGTLFLGRHLARTLVARGHAVSIFTRGRQHVDDDLPLVHFAGDRDGALAALPRDGWDAVIDTSAHWPSWVAASTAHLVRAARYLYVSSVSVYDLAASEIGGDDSAFVDLPADVVEGDIRGYGAFKKRSEDVVRAVFGPERSLVVRPGLIVGPHDPTNRFTYWVDRFADGGEILVPGKPHGIVQFIDVRDLADFMAKLLEDERSGVYVATGSPQTTTMGDVARACAEASLNGSTPIWVDDAAFLESHGIEGWMDLPLWIGPSARAPGITNARIDRALADGLAFRSLEDTVAATRAWSRERPADAERPAGITRSREYELLAAWKAASSGA